MNAPGNDPELTSGSSAPYATGADKLDFIETHEDARPHKSQHQHAQ